MNMTSDFIMRELSTFRKYPDDFIPVWEKGSDPHVNGLILANTLWDIRNAFDDPYVTDVDKTDADFLTVRTLIIEPKYFIDIRDWLVCLDLLFYSGNHADMIEDILDVHGIKEYYSVEKIDYNFEAFSEFSNIFQDNQIQEIDLKFTFNFFGKGYNKVYVSDNGFICFDIDPNNPSSPNPVPIANIGKPNAVIAPFWADFDPTPPWPGASSNIKYLNELDKFAVSWSTVKRDDLLYKFQAVLYNSGDIVFNYSDVPDERLTHTIGIENEDGTKGSVYNNFVNNWSSLKFSP